MRHYGPEYTAMRQAVGYLVRRAYKLLLPRAEALFAQGDLSFSHWIALKMIDDGVSSTSAEIARSLCHNTGATTRMIDQLEERGLVRRSRSSTDRRQIDLEITGAGKAAIGAAQPRMADLWNHLLQDFDRKEVTTLVALLTRLVDRFEADLVK